MNQVQTVVKLLAAFIGGIIGLAVYFLTYVGAILWKAAKSAVDAAVGNK